MNITLLKRALNQALSLGNKAFDPQFASFLAFSTSFSVRARTRPRPRARFWRRGVEEYSSSGVLRFVRNCAPAGRLEGLDIA